jgi:hypothetical protein
LSARLAIGTVAPNAHPKPNAHPFAAVKRLLPSSSRLTYLLAQAYYIGAACEAHMLHTAAGQPVETPSTFNRSVREALVAATTLRQPAYQLGAARLVRVERCGQAAAHAAMQNAGGGQLSLDPEVRRPAGCHRLAGWYIVSGGGSTCDCGRRAANDGGTAAIAAAGPLARGGAAAE